MEMAFTPLEDMLKLNEDMIRKVSIIDAISVAFWPLTIYWFAISSIEPNQIPKGAHQILLIPACK